MSLNFAVSGCRGRIVLFALHAFFIGLLSQASAANLIDVWRAEDLNLNDGDAVSTWTSTGSRAANNVAGTGQPVLRLGVTPAGGKAVRFNGNRMAISSSTVGGRTAFSLVYVFKATAVGANGNAQWYGKSGIVDAEQGGVTLDWGAVITETGNIGGGIGGTPPGDTSLYTAGASLVDGAYHVAVHAWGGGVQTAYVDSRAPVSATASTAARNNVGFSFGGINTDEGGATRRLVGDLVEIRFYDTALTSIEASNVIDELRTTHIFGTLPRIFSFTSTTNQIFLGQSVTLAWAVSNATSVIIDNGIGSVAPSNNIIVAPTLTTTYTLTATNTNGLRSAMVTVLVDPGIPTAFNFATNTAYNTPVGITLRGFDPQGSNLTYSIVNPPAHGSLGGSPPNGTYTPSNNFGGLDSFTFKVNDGTFDSAPATVSLNVIPPALPPTGVVLSSTNISSEAGPGDFIAALQAIDINNLYGDSHTFALAAGFGQNSQFAITGNVLSAGPSFAGGPGASFSLRIITTDSTSFSYTQDVSLAVIDVVRTVVINEIHYNGAANVVRDEFVELFNPSSNVIDISQWRVRGGVDFFFPPNTFLAPGSFVVVAEDPVTISNRHGVTAFGPWTGGLNNEGEELTLRD
ncbi:MAG TPA: lamin tail domain-containing protein, partial [Verrucomicrobiae bacterium]